MPYISSIHTSVPEHQILKTELGDIGEQWLGEDVESKERYKRIVGGAGVDKRHYILPAKEILSLNGLEQRAQLFEEYATKHLGLAMKSALDDSSVAPHDIDALLFTSCSVPAIPSIEAKVILESPLRNTIRRMPIFQHGCAGGVITLALGSRYAQLGAPVLISSVELCSLVFQPENHAGTQLVAAAIFADGAACGLISPDEGQVEILDTQSFLIKNSRHLMGYDIFDDGFHLCLDRDLPSALAQQAPGIVKEFLEKNDLVPDDITSWLFHPGGIKILNFLRDVFEIEQEQCHWSYDVLRECGNMSSATILFVLERFLSDNTLKKGEKALVMGIGPGLTVELVLLEGAI